MMKYNFPSLDNVPLDRATEPFCDGDPTLPDIEEEVRSMRARARMLGFSMEWCAGVAILVIMAAITWMVNP
jgi:hypothetical protein